MNPRVAHLVPCGFLLSSDNASDSSDDFSCRYPCTMPTEFFSLESDVFGTRYCFLAAPTFVLFGELDFCVAKALPFFGAVGFVFLVNFSFPSLRMTVLHWSAFRGPFSWAGAG